MVSDEHDGNCVIVSSGDDDPDASPQKSGRRRGVKRHPDGDDSANYGGHDVTSGLEAERLGLEQELQTQRELESALSRQLSAVRSHIAALESKIAQNETQRIDLQQSKDVWDCPMEWDGAVDRCAKQVFNISSFRPMQREAINAVLSKRDVFAVLPTGSGKSLVFQLPHALSAYEPKYASAGVCVVVSPLLALMHDQIAALETFGLRAQLLSSDSSKEAAKAAYDELLNVGGTRLAQKANARETASNTQSLLLYVTPERVAKSKMLMNKLEKVYENGRLVRFVIDESHCVSGLGHDFRPDYLQLGVLRTHFPNVPIIALTATANQEVVRDVTRILGIPAAVTLRAPFDRPNLHYAVRSKAHGGDEDSSTIAQIAEIALVSCHGQTGIVYCCSRKESEDVASALNQRYGVRAAAYHAMLSPETRSATQRAWCSGSIQVVVATIAFGLGIDKPDVRFVCHFTLSKSLESYYQESGRAGRDGESARCIVFFRPADVMRLSTMVADSPNRENALRLLYAIVNFCMAQQDAGRKNAMVCRRSILARHFSVAEVALKAGKFARRECILREPMAREKCCDVCDTRLRLNQHADDELAALDELLKAQSVVRIVADVQQRGETVTFAALVEAWGAGGKRAAGVRGAEPQNTSQPRLARERLILRLIVDGILAEQFHYTPYSIISYVVPGQHARKFLQQKTPFFLVKELDSCDATKSIEKDARANGNKRAKAANPSK